MEPEVLNCVTGCLLQELDENSEMLSEIQDELEEIFQTADTDCPISQEQLAGFKLKIDNFGKDFAVFRKECSQCKKKSVVGKIDQYLNVYNRAQEIWEILSA